MNINELKIEEERLRADISKLSLVDKKLYYQIEQQLIKDPDTYAVLNWFLPAGIHHFYLGKSIRGLINVVLMLLGLFTLDSYGVLIIIGILLIELPQLFKSQSIVFEYNNNVMKTALKKVQNKSPYV
jgi:TM2 domain-containing membrane protein YozV